MQLSHTVDPKRHRILASFLMDDFGNEIHVRAPYVAPDAAFFEIEVDRDSFTSLMLDTERAYV